MKQNNNEENGKRVLRLMCKYLSMFVHTCNGLNNN